MNQISAVRSRDGRRLAAFGTVAAALSLVAAACSASTAIIQIPSLSPAANSALGMLDDTVLLTVGQVRPLATGLSPEELSAIVWSSSDPGVVTVTSNGVLQGIAVGAATVTATSLSTSSSATISVSVTSPQPPPAPPIGFQVVTEQPFSEPPIAPGSSAGWTFVPGSTNTYLVASDGDAPESPRAVGSMVYPAGFLPGDAPAFAFASWPLGCDPTEIRVTAWLLLSENFVAPQSRRTKLLEFHQAPRGTPTPPEVHLRIQTNAGEGHSTVLVDLAGDSRPGDGSHRIDHGTWTRIDIALRMPSAPGAGDDSIVVTIEGDEEVNWTSPGLAAQTHFHGIEWAPLWGSVGSPAAEAFHMDLDHVLVVGNQSMTPCLS